MKWKNGLQGLEMKWGGFGSEERSRKLPTTIFVQGLYLLLECRHHIGFQKCKIPQNTNKHTEAWEFPLTTLEFSIWWGLESQELEWGSHFIGCKKRGEIGRISLIRVWFFYWFCSCQLKPDQNGSFYFHVVGKNWTTT